MPANRPLVLSKPDTFVAPEKSDYFFVIWNLYLTDKLTPITVERLQLSQIVEIIAFLPEKEDFELLHADVGDIPVTVVPYHHNHIPFLPREQYDEISKKIDSIAKGPRDKGRNILIFCNNGYQRSLPFLAYYMINYHNDEFPNVEKAVGYIINTIARQTTYNEKMQIIKSINMLFASEPVLSS
jgi:protein-tyrosine phosphatase